MTSDFNVKMTVRNARLLRRIREKYGTAAEMATTHTHTRHCLSSLYVAALTAAGVTLPASAAFSSSEILTIHHDPAPGDAWFARIVIYNGDGSADNIHRFDTPHGTVTVTYDSSPNQGCGQAPEGCADDVSLDVPQGVIPSEWEARLLELETRTIYLYEFLGG